MTRKKVVSLLIMVLCLSIIIVTIAFGTRKTQAKNEYLNKTVSGTEKYLVKNEYLKNPDSINVVADKSAKFWEKAYDTKYGGFYAYLKRDGSIDESKTYKISIIQDRNAFAFARAYQLTGNKEYLDYARKGLDFLYKYAWDDTNGGWYQEMNRDGSLVSAPIDGMNWNDVKWFTNEIASIAGMSAMYDATRSTTDETWLNKTYSIIDEKLYDSRAGNEGYYEMANRDWSNPNTKSPYPTLDSIPNNMEMYLLNLDSKYENRMTTLADISISKIFNTMESRKFGFVDKFDSNWNPMQSQPNTYSGNLLKPALYLDWMYLMNPKPEYKAYAEKLTDQIVNGKAYDEKNGGLFSNLNPDTGELVDNKKDWWIQEAGFNTGLLGYYVSKNDNYLKMADGCMDFFMNHIYDPEYGDAFEQTDADGSNPLTVKGDYWKEAYHTIELYYYTYLYGNLILHNKPVTLYYNIEADKNARNITLTPVYLGKGKLTITDVTLNGKKFTDFTGSTCMLKLPANTGGEFKVTFAPVFAK